MIKCFYILIFLLNCFFIRAQSIHFSQLHSIDVLVNPSNTGNFQGNWRINNIYREQGNNFTAPFRTIMVGFDKHFYTYGKQVSGGIYFINDMSAQNSLVLTKLYFTGAYHVNISAKMKLRFGLQAGIIQKSNNNNNLTMPEQFDMTIGQFNSSLPNSEIFAPDNIQYLDIGSGISGQYKDVKTDAEIGVAAFQLNKPHETFMNASVEIPIKYVLHGSVMRKIGTNVYLNPQFYYTWVKEASELVLGSQIKYELNNVQRKTEVYIAFYVRGGIKRNADAAIAAVGLIHDNWNYCISYDYDVSGLHKLTSRSNAFEVSVIYIRPETFVKEKTIPCLVY